MKAIWAALGIILLMSSIFIIVGGSLGFEKTDVSWKKDPNPTEVINSWNASRILNESDFFKVEIHPVADWNEFLEPAGGPYSMPYKATFVNITDPFGSETELLCDFLMLSDDPQKALVFYNVSGTGEHGKVETHGIEKVRFEIPYGNNTPGIVAQALSSGNYTATVTFLVGGGSAPNMKFTRGVLVVTKADYHDFYPVGVGVFMASVVLLVYGFRKPGKTGPKRKLDTR